MLLVSEILIHRLRGPLSIKPPLLTGILWKEYEYEEQFFKKIKEMKDRSVSFGMSVFSYII